MKITTEKEYNEALASINEIMKKGEINVSSIELDTLKNLTEEVSNYENKHYSFSLPKMNT